jgi:hypothetical protein
MVDRSKMADQNQFFFGNFFADIAPFGYKSVDI